MFPNDDICNVRAAKSAARRIFDKYSMATLQLNQNKGLGQQQISGLIKNAYSAINIAYDPNTSDVSSFMSVFGVGQNGTIELDKLEELAVKYLCGDDAFKIEPNNPEKRDIAIKNSSTVESEHGNRILNQSPNEQAHKYQSPLQFKNTGKHNFSQTSHANSKNFNLKFLSPKATQSKGFFSSKENTVGSAKSQTREQAKTNKKLTYSEVLNSANQIFNDHKNKEKFGITIQEAGEVMIKTYRLIGKMKFIPSEEDVKIWMKLCDVKKNGIVEWVSYQNFVKRMLERENILAQNEK